MGNDFLFVEQAVEDMFHPVADWKTRQTRQEVILLPRQVAIWTMYFFTKTRTFDISYYFGRRSACTVANSIKFVNRRIEYDYTFSCNIRMLLIHLKVNGYKRIYPHGRTIYENKDNLCLFPTRFAKPPSNRKRLVATVKPNLRQRLITERKNFIESYDVLKHKRRQIEKTTNVDRVILLAREISKIEIKMGEAVAQHTK